jgi:hypothetical protein
MKKIKRSTLMYDNNPVTLLNLRRLPARVDCQGAAVLLHFEPVALKALVGLGYLKFLGNPKGSEHKYFCTKTILDYAQDEKWLHEASRAVSRYWANKNSRRKIAQPLELGSDTP